MGKKLHGEYSIEIFGDYCIEIDIAMRELMRYPREIIISRL